MTAGASVQWFSLDPLMAEAKRRMWRRVLVVVVALVLGAAVWGGLEFSSRELV